MSDRRLLSHKFLLVDKYDVVMSIATGNKTDFLSKINKYSSIYTSI